MTATIGWQNNDARASFGLIEVTGRYGKRDKDDEPTTTNGVRLPANGLCGDWYREYTRSDDGERTVFFEGLWPGEIYCFAVNASDPGGGLHSPHRSVDSIPVCQTAPWSSSWGRSASPPASRNAHLDPLSPGIPSPPTGGRSHRWDEVVAPPIFRQGDAYLLNADRRQRHEPQQALDFGGDHQNVIDGHQTLHECVDLPSVRPYFDFDQPDSVDSAMPARRPLIALRPISLSRIAGTRPSVCARVRSRVSAR